MTSLSLPALRQTTDAQRWIVIPSGNNTFTIQQKSSGGLRARYPACTEQRHTTVADQIGRFPFAGVAGIVEPDYFWTPRGTWLREIATRMLWLAGLSLRAGLLSHALRTAGRHDALI